MGRRVVRGPWRAIRNLGVWEANLPNAAGTPIAALCRPALPQARRHRQGATPRAARPPAYGLCTQMAPHTGRRAAHCYLSAQGFVANDVESEQLVSEAETSSFGPQSLSRFASYVQHRGSIPLYWSQDTPAAMAGIKPPIQSIPTRTSTSVIPISSLKRFPVS